MALRRSLAWMGIGQAGFFVLQFAGSIVLARLLGPYDMGVFAVALAVVGVVSVMQSIGLNNYIVRERSPSPELVSTAATVNLAICIVMSLVIALLGLLGGSMFREPGVRDVLLVIAVVPIIGHFAFVPNAMLERESNFKAVASLKFLSGLLGMGITIVLAYAGHRYMSFAYSQVASALITNLVTNIVARRHLNFRLSLTHWAKLSHFGVQIFAISGLGRVAARVMEIVLGRTLGIAALGLYSRASNNHMMLWDSIHSVVGRVVFADFSRQRRDGGVLRERYLHMLEVMTGLLWPAFAGVALFSGPLIHLIYGQAWIGAAVPLAMLCTASILLVSTTMTWEVFVVCEETSRQVRLEVIRTAFGTTVFIAACFHSLEAAAAARIADALFAQFLYRPHLIRMTHATAADFGRSYLRSGAAALAAVTPALALMLAWRFSIDVPLLYLAGAAAAGIAAWLVALRLLNHRLGHELGRALRPLSKRFAGAA